MRTQYVAGFLFNEEKTKVALIKKNRPQWQKDKYNGIGGHIEVGDRTPLIAMIREFGEEAGLTVTNWKEFAGLQGPSWFVHFYWGIGDLRKIRQLTDESIEIFEIHELTELNVISNLRWLIPMALDSEEDFGVPYIVYKADQPEDSNPNESKDGAAYSHLNSRGQTYYLHSKDVRLRGSGRTQTIYYFAREIKDGALDKIPIGKMIIENERTGLLFLKNGKS